MSGISRLNYSKELGVVRDRDKSWEVSASKRDCDCRGLARPLLRGGVDHRRQATSQGGKRVTKEDEAGRK